LLPKIYNNFRLCGIANSQNWQIVQDGPAYKQCVIVIPPRRLCFHSC